MIRYPQFTIDEIMAVFRRRKKFFYLPLIFISVICISGTFLLPQKYKSSITISVQKDAVLNPLVSYTMAVTAASDDRLRDFNEIVHSRPTVLSLMDSLGLKMIAKTQEQKEQAIKEVKDDIETDLRGSDLFTINFFNPNPELAQKGAHVLSELFIKKRLEVNNKESELAVEFFENKLKDLGDKFGQSQQQYIETVRSSVLPGGDSYGLPSRIGELESQIGTIDARIESYQTALKILRNTTSNFDDPTTITNYYKVVFLDVPDADVLRSLLSKYEDLSKRYTTNFPDVTALQIKISDLTGRMKHTIESELTRQQNQVWDLQKQSSNVIGTIRSAEVSKNQNEDIRSTYDVYNKLYNDMKIKLEQARTNRDLGEKGAQQYVIIDPPQFPVHPAKPNKLLLIIGGIGLGLFIGFLSAGFMELFDMRIRTTRDIEVYDKPVLAYMPSYQEKK
ncbi:MAG: hypothetical protein FIA82_07535 [Melioribacter sp.]|nr:hypothetical protein [Melioribacter sp.]